MPRAVALLSLFIYAPLVLPSCQSGINQWSRCPVFCGLTGQVPHSNCTIFQLDAFNERIRPTLQKVLERPYFRFYKTQLNPNCSFWPAADQCFGQGCAIETCSSTELPDQLKRSWDEVEFRYTHTECEENDPLGRLDMSKAVCTGDGDNDGDQCRRRSYQQKGTAETFCQLPNDEKDVDSVIVDLRRNPERFTGYRGESSWRIWRAIYAENCFWPNPFTACKDVCNRGDTRDNLCFENQVFYNIISGFHASVNVHVCAEFFFPGQILADRWGYNLPEFSRRFGSARTNGEGTRFLKNLYFLYLLELRALMKAEPMLRQLSYDDCALDVVCCQGQNKPSAGAGVTYGLVSQLFDKFNELKCAFDESQMFRVDPLAENGLDTCASNAVREMFRTKFVNITRILDCVGCDKCRMWGRLQIKAVGTALNILFHDHTADNGGESLPPVSRTQLIALVNGFGRCSESLNHIAHFRKMSNEDFRNEL